MVRVAAGVVIGLATCGMVSAGLAAPDAPRPATWVAVKGRVVLPAGVPAPGPKAIPGAPPGVLDERVMVNPKNRGVRNVVVWVRPDNTDLKSGFAPGEVHPADARRKPRDVVLDQPRGPFEPRILAARAGDALVVKNSSPAARFFFWDTASNGTMNRAVAPGGGFRLPAPLAAERVPLGFKSGPETWAVGYARVFDHPYFAVTDGDGGFALADAPAGRFRIVYWHEAVGFKGGAAGRFGDPIDIAAEKDGGMNLADTEFDVTR